MNINEYESAIEAILFASGESVTASRLCDCLSIGEKDLKAIINSLSDKYIIEKRGIKIIQIDDSYQMCTNEIYYDFVSRLVKSPPKKTITQTLLETLSIIAYKQPVTKAAIEEIRGVSAEHAVNRLVEYGLVTEDGRLDSPGKPILFVTTNEFLRYYGLKTIKDLPMLPEFSPEIVDDIELY